MILLYIILLQTIQPELKVGPYTAGTKTAGFLYFLHAGV